MSRHLFKIRKKLTEAVDKYIWGFMFLFVYFGTIAAAFAMLSLL